MVAAPEAEEKLAVAVCAFNWRFHCAEEHCAWQLFEGKVLYLGKDTIMNRFVANDAATGVDFVLFSLKLGFNKRN